MRDKSSPREGLIPLAERLKDACGRAGALFTVNDDVELASLVGAAGVHLGEDDAPTRHARDVLGPGAVVGRSPGSVVAALEAVGGARTTSASAPSSPPRPSPTVRWPDSP